ncbi:MAG: ABC transporter ATP-binding protein [Halobacteriales archaeon]
MAAIAVDGLTKDYGDLRANDDLSFEVETGEVFGYLGPNGAGKTTTIRTLLGFMRPTSGTATVLGADIRDEAALVDAKRRIGYLPANPAFEEHVTGRELLEVHAALKGDDRLERLLDTFAPPLTRPIRELSTGNVQKLGLVQAFMHDPDLVVMDEPTAGLDPLMQREFNEFLREEVARGTTAFMSSHVLGEVRRVCDRVGILRAGQLVAIETVEDLLRRSGKTVRLRAAEPIDPAALDFEGVHDAEVHAVEEDGEAAAEADGFVFGDNRIVAEATLTFTGDINRLLDVVADYDLVDLEVEEAPLEDVFMRFYGGQPDA